MPNRRFETAVDSNGQPNFGVLAKQHHSHVLYMHLQESKARKSSLHLVCVDGNIKLDKTAFTACQDLSSANMAVQSIIFKSNEWYMGLMASDRYYV